MSERPTPEQAWEGLSGDARKLADLIDDSINGWENPLYLEAKATDPEDGFDLKKAKSELEGVGLLVVQPDIQWRREAGVDPAYVKSYDNDIWTADSRRIAEEPKYGLKKPTEE